MRQWQARQDLNLQAIGWEPIALSNGATGARVSRLPIGGSPAHVEARGREAFGPSRHFRSTPRLTPAQHPAAANHRLRPEDPLRQGAYGSPPSASGRCAREASEPGRAPPRYAPADSRSAAPHQVTCSAS